MEPRIAWVLNLDADLELARFQPGRGGGYAPSAGVARAMGAFADRARAAFVGERDIVIDTSAREGSAAGFVGRAFCPTPRAIAMLVRAGASPEPHPPVEILRRVASRAFAASLGATMPKSAFVTRVGEARALLRGDPAPGTGWRVKRAFGMAGRGHRVVDVAPRDADVAFLASWVEEDGVQIEPNVRVATEYAMHGQRAQDGGVELGALTRQQTDAQGAWVASERAPDAPRDVAAAIELEARRAADALGAAGYFGPFGVDAFTYTYQGDGDGDGDGARTRLRARSEINARYSMGFGVGFGFGLGLGAAR